MRSTSDCVYRSGRCGGAALLVVALLAALAPGAWGSDLTFRGRLRARARREGPVLEAIHLAGNESFDRATLLQYMRLHESGLLRTQRYERRLLEDDLANLERFYVTQGFMEAQAVIEDEQLSADSLKVAVLVGLYEGPRWSVTEVSFDGNDAVSDARLLRNLAVTPDGPFLSNELEADRRALLDIYARSSYLDATVVQTVEIDDDARTARIDYLITERDQASIGSIDVIGDDKTRQYVVEREFTFEPGDLFDPESIGETQARIYRTGLFNSVWMAPAPGDTGKAVKSLLVSVRERPSGNVDLKLGYATLMGPAVSAGLTNRNVQGQAIETSLSGTYSGFERGGEASIGDPWFAGRPIAAEATVRYYWNDEESYVGETAGGSFILTKRLGNVVTLEGGYEFERTIVLESDSDYGETGTNYTSSILGAVTYDTRDDILDAKRGMMARAHVDLASRRLGGTNDFVRYELTFRGFAGIRHGRVAAVSLRTGWVKPQGDGADVPENERYFSGGDGSVRGFDRRSLSPLDASGKPKGGRALVEIRAEVRFPVWRKLRAVVFADAGQTFDDFGAVMISGLEVGAGGGLRLGTPVGVVRFDVATPVTEDGPVKYYFGVGQAF